VSSLRVKRHEWSNRGLKENANESQPEQGQLVSRKVDGLLEKVWCIGGGVAEHQFQGRVFDIARVIENELKESSSLQGAIF